MKIILWKGYATPELQTLIRSAWTGDDLLVVCPPRLQDFHFLKHLPPGEVTYLGQWEKNPPEPPKNRDPWRGKEFPTLGVFTSGTLSGQPRLVLYSKKNIACSLDAIMDLFDLSQIQAIFSYAQPFHTFGLLLGSVLAIRLNCPFICGEEKYSRSTHEKRLALKEKNLLTLGTPTHFYDLLDYVRDRQIKVIPTYSCIIGGAGVTHSLWKRVQDELFIQAPSIGYGCTEASPGITHLPPGKEPLQDQEIGFPLRNLVSTPRPGVGLEIKGPSLCLAIIEKDQIQFPETCVIADLTRQREDGTWIFCGRTDLQLNRGGHKFSLEQIEELLRHHFNLTVAATILPDERLGQELGLVIQERAPEPKARVQSQITNFLEAKFGFKIKSENFVFCSELPMGANFKINRQKAALALTHRLRYPLSTTELFAWVPHRPPMVWVDEVLTVNEVGGEAQTLLKEDGLYFDETGLRPTAFIEMIAQTYAFVTICQNHQILTSQEPPKARVFLAALRDVQFAQAEVYKNITVGQTLLIKVGPAKIVGPIRIIEGWVYDSGAHLLCQANLKVYSESH